MLRFCPLNLKIMEKVVDVREAVRDDCQQIRCLIQELADFEEMPDGPKIDYQILEKDGFDCENPLFNCFVATCDNKIIGYALYFYIYSTLEQKAIHLEDLYVTPDFRQKHVGSKLFDTVAKKTFQENCHYLDFSVLSWNPAQTFYKAKGSVDLTEMEGWHMFRLDQTALQKIATNHSNELCQIREAQLHDFDVIKKLAQEAFSSKNRQISKDISIEIEEKNDLCSKHPYYGYLVVIFNDKVIGYTLYCYSYSTWEGKSMYLQEIYVTSNEHKTNITHDLLLAVAKKAYDEKCCRIDFWVLDPKITGKFYAANGAVDLTETEEWHLFRQFELIKKMSNN